MGSLHRLDGRGEAWRILRERLDRIAVRTVGLLQAGADLAAVVTATPTPTPTPQTGLREKAVADAGAVMNDLGP
ncbi:hypothetical protein SAMN05216489_00860 [Streptomyces sp. 3213]|uniref:hypothetical protein n=1 Tax=Streptomyces sp. 3213.3 TaxID=1855348 RepID=UPI00089C81FE|nr:hypothetical protein SAMN05216489_00860 [Streptomyces sp. 3213] [Streptomyces sp. 3213.3]